MFSKGLSWSLVMAVASLLFADAAHAVLPVDRIAVYSLRETPGDSQSPIALLVTMNLTAIERSGNTVAWAVESIEFDQVGDDPKQWIEEYPTLDTTDGLWWVNHASALDPTSAEFGVAPAISGTALAQDTAYDDLIYSFAGVANPSSPPPSGYSVARFSLREADQPPPQEPQAPTDEPVEVEGVADTN